MKTDDHDPVRRWQDVREFYADFAAKPGYGFLSSMIGFVEWVAGQPMAARLYPGTSHEWLTVSLAPGYSPESPFIAALPLPDGLFECELYAAVAELVDARICPAEEATGVFTGFVARLDAIGEMRPADDFEPN